MHNYRSLLLAVFIIVGVISGGCTSPAPSSFHTPSLSPTANQQVASTVPPETLMIRAASLSPGSVLPDVYTCKGASESPEVAWSGVPNSTKSLVLILDDPDAPNGRFTHWISTKKRGTTGAKQWWFKELLSPLPPDRDNTQVCVQAVRCGYGHHPADCRPGIYRLGFDRAYNCCSRVHNAVQTVIEPLFLRTVFYCDNKNSSGKNCKKETCEEPDRVADCGDK